MQGFKELSVKFSEDSIASHMLFMKPHSVREKIAEKPPGKTLFLIGVPPYCTEEILKNLFSGFGNVKNVFLHKDPTSQLPPVEKSAFFPIQKEIKGFKVAYVVFEREKCLKKLMENEDTLVLPAEVKNNVGIQKWQRAHESRIPDTKAMEDEITKFMLKYDKNADKSEDKEEVDEDGWVTVTKKGRRPGFARKESVKNQLMKRGEKQRKKKELSNFYRFQIREGKMKNLVALRQKFEEDKKKILALKQTRKFKPF